MFHMDQNIPEMFYLDQKIRNLFHIDHFNLQVVETYGNCVISDVRIDVIHIVYHK
ncbi:MAG: hypothetical protein ACTSU2_02440 [Promethearchaeota archaeon]